jgi:hypothetical protein
MSELAVRTTTAQRRACSQQMAAQSLDPHGGMFQIDPDKVDTVGDGFCYLWVGRIDTDPTQVLPIDQSLSELLNTFEEHAHLQVWFERIW